MIEIFSNINSPPALFALLLALGVVLINGFTDAPNAIATTVATGTLSMPKACALCAICNLLGLLLVSAVNMSVARSVFDTADFGESRQVALCAIFISVISFSLASWMLSMPSSESHALIAGIAGASLALSKNYDISPFFKIVFYMLMSCVLSFLLSALLSLLLRRCQARYDRLQLISCAASSFMHGAQDGQKLVAVLLFLSPSNGKSTFFIVLIVGITLFLGSLLGGGRIVKALGEGITSLNEKTAFISDISATLCLIFCSSLGLAVSTGNIKACSVAGAGVCDKKRIQYKTLVKMAHVALATFPVCMLISYALTRLFA